MRRAATSPPLVAWRGSGGPLDTVCCRCRRAAATNRDNAAQMSSAAAAPPDTAAAERLAALVADAVADARPPTRLLARLQALDAAGDVASAALGTSLFESIHYRLPAFSDDELPAVASRLYARCGRTEAALLLAGLAVQLRPRHEPMLIALQDLRTASAATATPPDPEIAARVEAIVREHEPGRILLLALEALDNEAGWPRSAALFEAIWPRVRPMAEYWVYHRMSQVYAALRRDDATALLATMAIQIEPFNRSSDMPHRLLLRHFRSAGRARDAAELCVRRHGLCAEPTLLGEEEMRALLAEAGPLALSPPPVGRRDRPLIERDVRRPRHWPLYGRGLPLSLRDLQRDMWREPIAMAELQDAEVLIDNGAVAVFGADGAPHIDLSVRCFPPLLRRQLAEPAYGPNAAEQIETDAAVLISDEFPGPNLCHFLMDHMTRLELYRRAGVEIGGVMVIGPELRMEYQRVTAERMGVRGYFPVNRRARLRVARLWVSSNVHNLRHPAHWAAEWAIRAIRDRFDLASRRPARRLLISRRDTTYRRISNEAQIANLLAPLGFEVIVPGELSFAEQIAAFRDATHIVSPHGAGLANALWCAPGTHILEVFHPHYGTWAYAMLNNVLDLNYATLVSRDGETDAPEFNDTTLPREQMVPHAGRDMWVDPDELERWLIASEVL